MLEPGASPLLRFWYLTIIYKKQGLPEDVADPRHAAGGEDSVCHPVIPGSKAAIKTLLGHAGRNQKQLEEAPLVSTGDHQEESLLKLKTNPTVCKP